MRLFKLFTLTAVMALILLWALQKEKQPKNWIEEPSDELMDFISK